MGKMKNRFITFTLIFIAGFVCGFGIALIIFSGWDGDRAEEDNTKIANENAYTPSPGYNTITIDDQKAGNTVFVSLTTLSRSAWIAIHEENGGAPGNILGARYFSSGKTAGTVELLRATTAGNAYYAIIHEDDGDREFDFRNDLPLQDPFGNYFMAEFRTTVSE